MTVKPLSPSMHILFWSGALIFFVLAIILFNSVLLPFVIGIAVAYLLNPVVNKLGEMGIGRSLAALIILGGFLTIVLALCLVFMPILYRELLQLSKELPFYIEQAGTFANPYLERLEGLIGRTEKSDIEGFLKDNAGSAVSVAKVILDRVASGGQAIVDMISVVIVMPIVAYFMMKEWPSITKWVLDLIPRHSEKAITDLLKKIDLKLAGFVRGQFTVAIMLGVCYAIVLTIVGLKFGILIGLVSGVLGVIPLVGSTVGFLISVVVAWFQTGDLVFVLIVAAIFFSGQVIEGNFLTPKFVGESVGLHPLWIFFALMAGASLLGVLGMFLAVPIAAVAGVLLSFALQKYKQSPYYRDTDINESA
ncbi:MAG: AI-2E family transporter [Alphaproteobacteria bacterium]|nr:AI-2E family transporter [Alphaproteobacteria bacterium]